ncbi:uncharacterized protein LDX57_004946 [Aspergillus melleus]|uniref:uncharacterized protein n=1 Tax=Aspergillus melleus TaxID=138277 RepID=UPI001E8CBE6B|nr:uncharacterized protein LDX57_004946 [Aspergillus melleus]KAH8427232.1 hypothetical protein LDX57_004946 [Aspergillus melleus]
MRLFDGLFSRFPARATSGSQIHDPAARPTIETTCNEITPTACSVEGRDSTRSDLRNGNNEPCLDNPQCPALCTDPGICYELDASPQFQSTPQRRPARGSRRLAGFKTLLRPRKSHRHIALPAQVDGAPVVSQRLTHTLNGVPVGLGVQYDRSLYAATEFPCNKFLDIDVESRKVSDTTTQSLNSEQTSGTVCRHPSRSASTPIALVDREETITQSSFTDTACLIHQIPTSNPFSDPSTITTTTEYSTRQQSSEYSGPSTRFITISGSNEMEEIPLAQRYPSSVMDDVFARKPSNSGKGLVKFDQRAAVTAFNEFGPKLGLKPLKLVKADTDTCSGQTSGW